MVKLHLEMKLIHRLNGFCGVDGNVARRSRAGVSTARAIDVEAQRSIGDKRICWKPRNEPARESSDSSVDELA